MPYTIRDATPGDLDRIVEFNARIAEETEDRSLPREPLRRGVAALLDDPGKGRYFLAADGADLAGQLMLTTEWSDWRNGDFWWIQSVYVAPDHRRRGVFRALYEHVLKLARTDPAVCGLRLYHDDDNVAARQVYLNVGMHLAGYRLMEVDFSESARQPQEPGDAQDR